MAGPGEPRVDLADLIDRLVSESGGAVTALRRFPARPAQTVPIPDTIDPQLADALRARGIEALYTHQAQALELLGKGGHCVVVTPTASGKTLCYNLPVLQATPDRVRHAGALPLPHQGARPGPAGGAGGAGARAAGAADPHVRRGHPAGRAPRGPGPGQRRADEPRHAPRGDPAAPHEVDRALPEPALRHHRRAPHVPRRLREPPRQRAAPAAAHLPALRRRPAVHLHVGDDRQPPGARGAADRIAGRSGRGERRARRREGRRLLQPAGRQPRARDPPAVPQGGEPAGDADPPGPGADHRLHGKPARGGGRPDRPQGGRRAGAGVHGRDPRLPRGVPAEPAARGRAGPPRGRGARRRVDERARARHRHRAARRGAAGRLPGHGGLHLAAGGPGRAADRALGGGPGGVLGPARPVHRHPSRLLLRRAPGARADQPRQPLRPGEPSQVRGVRASVRRGRALRRGGRRPLPPAPRGGGPAPSDAAAATTGPARATRRITSRSAAWRATTSS